MFNEQASGPRRSEHDGGNSMTEMQLPEVDPGTKELIEATFGEQIYIKHEAAATLLQIGREELTKLGDLGRIRYQLKGKRQRRYTR